MVPHTYFEAFRFVHRQVFLVVMVMRELPTVTTIPTVLMSERSHK
jgi:hypothetical protein